jgi:hypothetical protein
MENEAISRYAAQVLAYLKVPNFDDFSEDDVFEAFSEAMRTSEFDEWMLLMQQEISNASNGSVSFVKTSFYTGIKGINRQFVLKSDGRQQKVVVCSSVPPISFMS